MSVTASRLGSSPITVDWSNLGRRSTSGGGYPVSEAWTQLKGRFTSGEIGFYQAPLDPEISQLDQAEALAAQLVGRGGLTDCLFLGIGGSSLGPMCVLSALQDLRKNQIRFHFMENPDPLEWKSTLKGLNPESTLICVVTKSGNTFETIAQFLLALDWVGRNRWSTHVVAITDAEKGDLKLFATAAQIPTLTIASNVGGRFSVFTPVGLFAAALAGLNIKDFLKGAAQVHDYMEKSSPDKNAILTLAREILAAQERQRTHVCMPYSSRLKLVGHWFVQLWGESLGKDGKGFTPLAAVGATDQHSILQLLRDGPDDKMTFFITVDRVQDPVMIPRTVAGVETSRFPAFSQLHGHSLHELLGIEYRATALVLSKRGRPHLTFQLDQLDERALGALTFSLCVLTALTGTLMGVNPFDQPGVEEGKVYIRQSLTESRAQSQDDRDENSPVARLRRHTE